MVFGHFGPTIGGHHAVFGIQAHNDLIRESITSIAQKLRIFNRSRADDHVRQAQIQVFFYGIQIANTAAQLHRHIIRHCGQNVFNGAQVLRFARKSTIQIDQMQTARALRNPMQSHVYWLVRKHRRVFHQTLTQTHTLTVFQIDGRNQ